MFIGVNKNLADGGAYWGKLFLRIGTCKFLGRGRGFPISFVKTKMVIGGISFIKWLCKHKATIKTTIFVWRHSYKAYFFRKFSADTAKSNVFNYFMIHLNQAYTLVCPEYGNKIALGTTYLFLRSFVLGMNINFLEQNVTTFSKNYFACTALADEMLLGN